MKTFYRVEHGVDKFMKKYYLGMYDSSVGVDMQELSGSHPHWHEDVRLVGAAQKSGVVLGKVLNYDHTKPWLFAFDSLTSLKRWVYMSSWREELHRLGYVVSVYECDEGFHGHTQSVFYWEKAQMKHRINLLEV